MPRGPLTGLSEMRRHPFQATPPLVPLLPSGPDGPWWVGTGRGTRTPVSGTKTQGPAIGRYPYEPTHSDETFVAETMYSHLAFGSAGVEGLEPPMPGPEPGALPLGYTPTVGQEGLEPPILGLRGRRIPIMLLTRFLFVFLERAWRESNPRIRVNSPALNLSATDPRTEPAPVAIPTPAP